MQITLIWPVARSLEANPATAQNGYLRTGRGPAPFTERDPISDLS
jgi:hypothetical protein